jgi:hypothetical protein
MDALQIDHWWDMLRLHNRSRCLLLLTLRSDYAGKNGAHDAWVFP